MQQQSLVDFTNTQFQINSATYLYILTVHINNCMHVKCYTCKNY